MPGINVVDIRFDLENGIVLSRDLRFADKDAQEVGDRQVERASAVADRLDAQLWQVAEAVGESGDDRGAGRRYHFPFNAVAVYWRSLQQFGGGGGRIGEEGVGVDDFAFAARQGGAKDH